MRKVALRAYLPLTLSAVLISACVPGEQSSSTSSSTSSSAPSSQAASSFSSREATSSSSSLPASNITQPQANHYNAPKASSAPVIDGVIDGVWAAAPWQAVDVLWLGAQGSYPSAADYTGRFKVIWDANRLYILMDVIDDVIYDHAPNNPTDQYWIDDTVELFIDEDHSGGDHQYNNFANAWAYHISTLGDNVDSGLSGVKLYNDHVDVAIKSEGTRHLWEISMLIYGDNYNDQNPQVNTPLTLFAGKEMGFSASYIDNDNSIPASSYERESMMGSVNTQGHMDNLGYQNADVLGSLTLVE